MDEDTLSCDVLIVGGGPAGLAVASTLPDDVSTVIVHQDQEIGLPVRTSGGSWLSDVKRLGIPPQMYQVLRKTEAYSDKFHSELKLGRDVVVILNTPMLYKWLAAQSDGKDRKLFLSTKFLTTRQRADGLYESQLRSRSGGPSTIVSRFIVDGSGWHLAVLTALGLAEKPGRLGVGTEYEYPIGSNPPDRGIIFVGRRVPSGYGWAFPTVDGKLRIGVGVIQPDTDASSRALLDEVVRRKRLLKRYGIVLKGKPQVHSGILPSVAYDDKLVYGNVIRTGDSANFATPTVGEGIRHCIEYGRVLGEALGIAVTTGNRRPLKAYERRARRRFKRDYKWGLLINTRAAKFTPQQWNNSVRRMGMVEPEALAGLLRNELGRRKIARMIWTGGRHWLRSKLTHR